MIREIKNRVLLIMEMSKTKKHPKKMLELSIIELKNLIGKKYKVTRRLPELSIAETKIFRTKKRAKALFNKWLE